MNEYFNTAVETVSKKQPHEDVNISIDEVLNRLETFKYGVSEIFNKPPPK